MVSGQQARESCARGGGRGTRSHSPPPLSGLACLPPACRGPPLADSPLCAACARAAAGGTVWTRRAVGLGRGRGSRWADVCKHPRWNLLSEMMSAVLKFQTQKDTGCLCLSQGPEPDKGDEREPCQTLGAGPGPRDKDGSCHAGQSQAGPHAGPANPHSSPPGLASPCDLSPQTLSPEGGSPVPWGSRVGSPQPTSKGHSDSTGELGGGGCERPRAPPQAHHEYPPCPSGCRGHVRRDRVATPLPCLHLEGTASLSPN